MDVLRWLPWTVLKPMTLRCMVSRCVAQYYRRKKKANSISNSGSSISSSGSQGGGSRHEEEDAMASDDLLPILEYLTLLAYTQFNPPLRHFVAHLDLIDRLLGRSACEGEEGFCLVSFQAIMAEVLRPENYR